MSPTARTLKALKDAGWTAGVVEKWNAYTRTRHDLFGCIDIVAVRPGEVLGVQATSADHISHRLAKIAETPEAAAWLDSGARLEVWGWKKRKVKKDGKAMTWQSTVRTVSVSELHDGELAPGGTP